MASNGSSMEVNTTEMSIRDIVVNQSQALVNIERLQTGAMESESSNNKEYTILPSSNRNSHHDHSQTMEMKHDPRKTMNIQPY